MKQIINRKLYNTATAILIADNEFQDGTNRLNTGTAQFLYKTPRGNYFLYKETIWQGCRDSIEALTKEEAKNQFEKLFNHEVGWEEAFDEPVELA